MVQNTVRRLSFRPPVSRSHVIIVVPSEVIKEPAAEFFGVMILIIFGAGVDCQTVLSTNTAVAASPMGVSMLLLRGGRDPTSFALLITDARL